MALSTQSNVSFQFTNLELYS